MMNIEKSKVVKRRITDSFEIDNIRKFHDLPKSVKGESRLCSKHNFPVDYNYEYTGNSIGMPFFVTLSSCCDEAIESEIEFINNNLKENSRNEDFI